MARRQYSSTAQRTTLSSSCTNVATTLNVTAVTGWPASTPYTIIVDPDTVNEEVILVTSRVSLALTCTRGVGGTTAVAHSSGAVVQHGVYSADFDEPNAFLNAGGTVGGTVSVTGNVSATGTVAATSTVSGSGLAGSLLSSATPAALGTAAAGSAAVPARQDHVHSSVFTPSVNAITAAGYTLVLADQAKTVTLSNASNQNLTVPTNASVAFPVGTYITFVNKGAGTWTFAGTPTINSAIGLTLSTNETKTLYKDATDTWYLAGGAVPKASVSSTTGSPTTGANGSKTYYKFNASGSVTIGTGGTLDMLVIGGGAGGGGTTSASGSGGGGGGAGGYVAVTTYLAAGTYTVTVGAGGAGGVAPASGTVGSYSLCGSYVAPGGGSGAGGGGNPSDGGSGGGARGSSVTIGAGITGLGTSGGTTSVNVGGGGGGATGAGSSVAAGVNGGAGGTGTSSSIDGTPTTRGGGGGGGAGSGGSGGAGTGGGGTGGAYQTVGGNATANTGGGGGGCGAGNSTVNGGAGGSGIVILLIG